MKSVFKAVLGVSVVGLLQGCVFDEAGDEYIQPDNNTNPKINIDYNSSYPVNTYATFGEGSANINVRFGDVNFTMPTRSEMRLRGFGGFETDRVWKTSVLTDSRGIKTLRMGYYVLSSGGNDIGPPVFHNLARDDRGNVYLTETSEQLRSDLGVAPTRQSSPALLFPAEVKVGGTWVAGPSLVPLYYNFTVGAGWTAELVSDNATAPISGVRNCIVIKYYGPQYAYYLYLKSGQGVVEWINSWSEVDGKIVPENGWAISRGGSGTTDIDFTDYGWQRDTANSIGAIFTSIGLKVVDGEEAHYDAADTSPVNDTGYDFYRVVESLEPSPADLPILQQLRLPFERDQQVIDFTEARWDDAAFRDASDNPHYYSPLIEVELDGKTYVANQDRGSFIVEKLGQEPFGPMVQTFLGQGVLENKDNAADTRRFTGLLKGIYLNANADGLQTDAVIHGLNRANCAEGSDVEQFCLPAGAPGETYRFFASYTVINEFLQEGLSIAELPDGFPLVTSCFGGRTPEGLCKSRFVAFEFTIPDGIEDDQLTIQVLGTRADDSEGATSNPFYLPIKQKSGSQPPVARLYDSHDDVIRGKRIDHDNDPNTPMVFDTEYINALASVDPDGGPIVNYAWDFGDGTVLDDGPPLGSYSYTEDGEYLITLTVTDSEGQSDKTFRKVVVTDEGQIIIKNLASNFGSGSFRVGIYNLDEDSGYYDIYTYVFLDSGEQEVFDVPGDVNYEIDIIKDGEVVRTENYFVAAGGTETYEVNLD